jgi:hypothetical protein
LGGWVEAQLLHLTNPRENRFFSTRPLFHRYQRFNEKWVGVWGARGCAKPRPWAFPPRGRPGRAAPVVHEFAGPPLDLAGHLLSRFQEFLPPAEDLDQF